MPDRPNLVFIFTDRQRFDTMRCYGNDWIDTPNLNALAEQSAVIEHAYVTQPICCPARSSIMTGLYPHASGVPRNRLIMPPGVRTLAEMVSEEYRRAYYGKWHLGDEVVRQHGFDEWVSIMDTFRRESSRKEYRSRASDYHAFLRQQGHEPDLDAPGGKIFSDEVRAALPAELQMASFLADRAVGFIERNRTQPFVLYVGFLEPHPPFTGPFDHLYDPATLPVDPTFLKRPERAPLFNRLRSDFFMSAETEGHDLTTEIGWRRLRANYLGNITLVDNAVGKIVDALDRAGVADNTVVVFTSEHGELAGSHAMLQMRAFYEAACSVPLIIRVPWLVREQTRIGGNLSQIDLVPTLLELLDQPVPDRLHGVSRAAVLRGDETLRGNDVVMVQSEVGYDGDLTGAASRSRFTEQQRNEINLLNALPRRSIVSADRWKLNLCVGDRCELFDLNSDPDELENLFDAPSQRDRVRHMAARIRLWQHRTGDSAPLPGV